VDQVFSEPILKRFQEKTGITVKPVYDVEAAKTTGLVNRLIAEKNKPLCDVWWNGEIVQTILLAEEGVLAPYKSPSAKMIPGQYVDLSGAWTGFGGRVRVLIVNTNLVSPSMIPDSIFDLAAPGFPAKNVGIAYPIFGTTATHAAALYAEIGPERTKAFFTELQKAGVTVVDGNSVVRDLVAEGQLYMGMTDTDDAIGALEKGAPVKMVFLDQGEAGIGTPVIPNTVALIKGAPHTAEAKEFIDYLLSEEVEAELVEAGWFQVPLRRETVHQPWFDANSVKDMKINYSQVYTHLEQVKKDLAEIFVR
jgi:iron(III) transport system substrate-binding protein